ncbi:Pycsar system effector family protein [Mariniflexile sp. HNIBRBA6329]|uniref:Pycsar system effector family protein n=1 Tax=Mariniflexile sp. HNIBRBA6329 TaxID=3373088 RepID=UPI003746D1EA
MNELLTKVENYVSSLLRRELPHVYIYHNLSHTQRVVNYTKEIIDGENITESDAENLIISSWFHDTGYIKGTDNHEEESIKIAVEFLKKENVLVDRIEVISNIILATKMGYDPKNKLEQIIRDADCAHFGHKNFIEISELLRYEWEQLYNKTYSDSEWTQENISFLTKNHQFYTHFAIENWQEEKDKNIAILFKTIKKQKQQEKNNSAKKYRAKIPERGIDTLFRVTLRNHIALSEIADSKANILLSVNAIIVSLVLSNLIPKLDNPSNHYLIYPTIIFTLFTVTAMILSVLATRPNVTGGKFTKEDVKNKKVNLLFFGNFHKMGLDDFEWAMGEMMQDRDYLYSSMKKDLYFLGLVLNKKYKILRITYTVFMIGIIVSVVAFGVAFQHAGNMN